MKFTYYLAHKLGRMVWELDDMPYIEFIRWNRYFAQEAQQREIAHRMVG